jgi:calcineurin-like phosphoesterase family protein
MNIWFTSDLHLGHVRIIELCKRPFANVDEMNEAIIENWNSVVKDGDRVYVLGDVALGTIANSLPLCQRLNGLKYLIPGNHDRVWSSYGKKIRELDVLRYEEAGFIILDEDMIYKTGWRLCHFPYVGDSHDEDRYRSHRPVAKSDDEWLLHGHVHEKWKVNGRQINVGVDVWDFTPVHEDEIKDLMLIAKAHN